MQIITKGLGIGFRVYGLGFRIPTVRPEIHKHYVLCAI